jgi:hypothetical protein
MLGKLVLGALCAAVAIQSHAAAGKTPPPDGTVVRVDSAGGQAQVALMVGGARLPLTAPMEVAQAARGTRVRTMSVAAYRALPQQVADGTYLTAPGTATIWVVSGGRRSAVPPDEIPLKHVQVVPAGVLERIPAVRSHR